MLTHFLLYHQKFFQDQRGKIFEFGSGMAIPSLAALKSKTVDGVILQELNIQSLLEMQRLIFDAHGLNEQSGLMQLPLKWGTFPPTDFLEQHGKDIRIFVAADCLYERNGTYRKVMLMF